MNLFEFIFDFTQPQGLYFLYVIIRTTIFVWFILNPLRKLINLGIHKKDSQIRKKFFEFRELTSVDFGFKKILLLESVVTLVPIVALVSFSAIFLEKEQHMWTLYSGIAFSVMILLLGSIEYNRRKGDVRSFRKLMNYEKFGFRADDEASIRYILSKLVWTRAKLQEISEWDLTSSQEISGKETDEDEIPTLGEEEQESTILSNLADKAKSIAISGKNKSVDIKNKAIDISLKAVHEGAKKVAEFSDKKIQAEVDKNLYGPKKNKKRVIDFTIDIIVGIIPMFVIYTIFPMI